MVVGRSNARDRRERFGLWDRVACSVHVPSLSHAAIISPFFARNPIPLVSPATKETTFKLSMQYVEIYNEKIKDLLNPSDANLDVREVPSKGTYVAGATDKSVRTMPL